TVAELQDQILFYLNEYLVHETKGRILHRRFCEDFEGWTRPIWSKVSTPLRTKLRNELDNRGVVFSNEFEEESDEASEDRDDIEDPSSADLNDMSDSNTGKHYGPNWSCPSFEVLAEAAVEDSSFGLMDQVLI
ncbi:hypothetical protein E4U22_001186, partial [Claviceps purpurea]